MDAAETDHGDRATNVFLAVVRFVADCRACGFVFQIGRVAAGDHESVAHFVENRFFVKNRQKTILKIDLCVCLPFHLRHHALR